jgi:DNA-binding GntR family transcriptional regulator
MLASAPSLTDQVYNAIVDEICGGRLSSGSRLVQERLAERFGVSRQPVQQAMVRLKADGIVEELGRRGLFVTALDAGRMRDHYGVRAALDGWAAKTAAQRISGDPELSMSIGRQGRAALKAGRAAAGAGDVAAQVRCDDAFHFLIYAASGNPMLATTAEPHWRFLRRAMGVVLRKVEPPREIWRQHGAIFDAVMAGDGAAAEERAVAHVMHVAGRLASILETCGAEEAAS